MPDCQLLSFDVEKVDLQPLRWHGISSINCNLLFIYLQIYLPGYIKNGRPYQNCPKNLKDTAISPDTIRGGKW